MDLHCAFPGCEPAVIAGLHVFNAALRLSQEGLEQAAVAAPKSWLTFTVLVRSDAAWNNIPTTDLVLGDGVKLSLGGMVAAEAKLVHRSILPQVASFSCSGYTGVRNEKSESAPDLIVITYARKLHSLFSRARCPL